MDLSSFSYSKLPDSAALANAFVPGSEWVPRTSASQVPESQFEPTFDELRSSWAASASLGTLPTREPGTMQWHQTVHELDGYGIYNPLKSAPRDVQEEILSKQRAIAFTSYHRALEGVARLMKATSSDSPSGRSISSEQPDPRIMHRIHERVLLWPERVRLLSAEEREACRVIPLFHAMESASTMWSLGQSVDRVHEKVSDQVYSSDPIASQQQEGEVVSCYSPQDWRYNSHAANGSSIRNTPADTGACQASMGPE